MTVMYQGTRCPEWLSARTGLLVTRPGAWDSLLF